MMGSRSNTTLAAARAAAISHALMDPNGLNYHGGMVQRLPKIYIDYWQFSSDPAGVMPYLSSYLGGIGSSPWLSTVTQYYEKYGPTKYYISNPSHQLANTWNDNTNAIAARPTSNQVDAEALRAAKHFGDYTASALYVIALPSGHDPVGFKTQWCAYHGSTAVTNGQIAYVNLPYMPDAGANCGENIVNAGSAGTNDGTSIVAGHEVAEAQTDPQPPSGWTYYGFSEIGDMCAWQGLANTTLSTGSFAVQPLFSDATNSCVLSY